MQECLSLPFSILLRVLDQFDSLPGHLTEDLHLFSLSDLTAVRNGDLTPRLKELLKLGTMHVAGCVVRHSCGFIPGTWKMYYILFYHNPLSFFVISLVVPGKGLRV